MNARTSDAARFARITGLVPLGESWDYADARQRFYEELSNGSKRFLRAIERRHARQYSSAEINRLTPGIPVWKRDRSATRSNHAIKTG